MDVFPRNVAGFFFQPGAESFDFVAAQSNINFADFRAGCELAQSANQNRHAAEFAELFGRARLLALENRSRGHARPQSSGRNNYDHLHGGLQVYEPGLLQFKSSYVFYTGWNLWQTAFTLNCPTEA